jgi:glutamate synthase (ferredoxin)
MNEGRIIEDDDQECIVTKRPYRKWLDENLLHLAQVPYTNNTPY